MNFTTTKKILLSNLKKIQGVAEKNPVVPITSHMLVEVKSGEFVISATNFETGIKIFQEAKVKSEGKTVLDAKKVFDIIKEMPDGEIQVVKDSGFIKISQGESIVFNISEMSDEEFPTIDIEKKLVFSKIDNESVKDLIKYTLYAASGDRARDILRGVLVEKEGDIVRMVATDGHRLALSEKKMPDKKYMEMRKGVVVPQKGMREIGRMVEEEGGEIEIGFGDKSVVVKRKKETLIVRLIDGEFPNYRNVIPKDNKKTVFLKRKDLIETLRRVSLLVEEETKAIKFTVKDGLLTISSKKTGLGDAKEERELEYKGEGFEFALNSRYIMDVLGVMDAEEVRFEVSDEKTPVVIKEKGDSGVLAVIMPMIL